MIRILFSIALSMSISAQALPKYGPKITLLRNAPERVRRSPDFWSLIPYYVGQRTDASCSTAAASMLLNALRHPMQLKSEDMLFNHEMLVAKLPAWGKATQAGGTGVTLDIFADYLGQSFRNFGLKERSITIKHVLDKSDLGLKLLQKDLRQNEAQGEEFILVNFLQGALTGDGDAGHFSLVGAYDADTHSVLILDVDREWYEPYWVSDRDLLEAMATKDSETGKMRGYLYIR